MQITVTVNGQQRTDEVEPRLLLVHHLREVCGLRAANVGCDTSSCGACTVLLDGEVAGTWRPRKTGKRLTLQVEPWRELPVADLAATFVPPRCAYVPQVPRLVSASLRDNLAGWGDVLGDRIIVSLMKGVELGTTKRMSEVIAEAGGVPPERIAVGVERLARAVDRLGTT